MKVITIGRSSENDITVNSPNVSRHHCQIVQFDNGTFGIVDFNSTNGTFVNGQRVYGQGGLKRGDRVQLAQTEVSWQQYFSTAGTRRKKWWLWPTIGGAAAVMVAVVFLFVMLFYPRNVQYESSSNTPTQVSITKDGEQYSVYAIPGEVIIIFDNDVSHNDAKHIIKQCGGGIIAQTPKSHYYIASVNPGEEDAFIHKVRNRVANLLICPNTVSICCMAKPVVIDNFKYVYEDYNATHGEMVKYSFDKGSGNTISVDFFNVSVKNTKNLNTASVNNYIHSVLENASEKDSPIINLSMGPGFLVHDGYWDDAPVLEKKFYRFGYILDIISTIWTVRYYDERDFVIVKSLGNEGIKNFDKEILQPLMDNLSDWEKNILERHFLLVAAKDDYATTYSNEMSHDTYNSLITTTDISDLRFNRKRMHGTSYSSPRVAGYISKIINDYGISAVEALQFAKQATKQDPNHLLLYKNLDDLVKKNMKQEQDYNSNNNVASSSNDRNDYKVYGCLKYRLIKDNELEDERLELRNTCNEDIRVTGSLLNTIAPHGGKNTLDFETIVRAMGTEYVEGFLENECTIRSVEKVKKNPSKSNSITGRNLVGTMWKNDHSNRNHEYYDVLRFDSESTGTALSVLDGENTVITHFHYCYEKEYDGWCITDWGNNKIFIIIKGNELQEGFYEPCGIDGEKVILLSTKYYRM